MKDIIEFIVSNAGELGAAIVAAHALALIIVNLTPTPKDDAALAKVYPWIEKLAGILSSKAKETSSKDAE